MAFSDRLRFFTRRSPAVLYDRLGQVLGLRTTESGELVTAQRSIVFDSKQVGIAPDAEIFATRESGDGTATYNPLRSSTSLTVAASGEATRQTRVSFTYRPGLRSESEITFIAHTLTGDGVAQVGRLDDFNGIYLELGANGAATFNIRTDVSGSPVVGETLPRSQWLDPLDGTGPSRLSVDLSKGVILWIGFAWFGLGTVACGFRVNDQLIICAKFEHGLSAQAIDAVYMRNPNLPIGWRAIAGAGSVDLEAVCCMVANLGGNGSFFLPRSDLQTGVLCPAGAITEVVSGKLRDGSSATVRPTGFGIVMTGNASGVLMLVARPTWSAGVANYRLPIGASADAHAVLNYSSRTVTYVDATYPNVGHVFLVAPLEAKSSASISTGPVYALGRDVDGTADELSVLLHNTSAQLATITVTPAWTEAT